MYLNVDPSYSGAATSRLVASALDGRKHTVPAIAGNRDRRSENTIHKWGSICREAQAELWNDAMRSLDLEKNRDKANLDASAASKQLFSKQEKK